MSNGFQVDQLYVLRRLILMKRRTTAPATANLVLDVHQQAVLAKLGTVDDAAFDSHAGEHDPRYHPNTRVDLLHQIDQWTDDPSGKCVFLLNGMAGTGKSTILRTVTRKFADRGAL